MKIGILGGTFDPVHSGHINAAIEVLRLTDAEEIWLLPCPRNPLKSGTKASFSDRLKMAEIAVEGHPRLKVSDFQETHNLTYSIDTVRALKRNFSEHSFYLIIGSDLVEEFPRWREAEKILEEVRLVIVPLPDPAEVRNEMILEHDPIVLNHAKRKAVSSTLVREAIAHDESSERLEALVPKKVLEFIEEKGIYR